jgi:hypothetical protein
MINEDSARTQDCELSEEELAALRHTVRKRVLWAAQLQVSSKRYDCIVVDLSLGGARLHFAEPIEKGEKVVLLLDRVGNFGAEVIWQQERSIGVRFTDDPQHIAQRIGGRLPLTTMPSAASA